MTYGILAEGRGGGDRRGEVVHRWTKCPRHDGADLGLALVAHPGDTEAALAAHEERMFARAERSAAESAESGARLFRADAPQGLVDMFAADGTDVSGAGVSGATPSA